MSVRCTGFTLLEAIVALVILSGGLLAAYAWFSQDMRHLIKINDLALEETVVSEAVDRLELVDFAKQATGDFQWGDYQVMWEAVPLEPSKQGRTPAGGVSLYDLTLYQVHMRLSYRGRHFASPQLRMVKYRQARKPAFQEG